MKRKVLIMGAAGRDFHNFNVFFRDNPNYEVVAFTATQIPDIEGRIYPPALAGKLYPKGIPIYSEQELTHLIRSLKVNEVVFAYSDVSNEYVMGKAAEVMAAGADFVLLGPGSTALKSIRPVVSICAVRTGSGKSQTTRRVVAILRKLGKKVVVIRHPMPYGNLEEQAVQRFATLDDLVTYKCTIEEREEYEPHIERGAIVYSGVDYGAILKKAEMEAEVIVWDGGNNDFPFYVSDLKIVVADPLRPGHERLYHPGQTNSRMADVLIINKVDTASREQIETVRKSLENLNPSATIIEARSTIKAENMEAIKDKRVLVIEDGPTVTHGEMGFGAGYLAAKRAGAREIVDPRPFARGSIQETFRKYPHLTEVLPAMGYGEKQMKELEETINASDCDLVIIGTPINLTRFLKINKETVRIYYELEEVGHPDLEEIIRERLPL
ncbi:MAG: cyclic 2,3-diphosphoglycerate synthase [Caldiserica bacterium]|jgi:predicted GTPase|nr:cyclic 2,3-diphosphoglycerate synthase [Caldisericota bacterium]MDH7562499.1 cyclic 2,3-diphosphoglycerate synthase [Caldisericota bacterium]